MSSFSIWVLVAGEHDAVICASDAGSSRLLRVMKRGVQCGDDETDRRDFAWQLMSELSRSVENGACEGVILIADKEMLEALGRVMLPEVRQVLLAEIPGAAATICVYGTFTSNEVVVTDPDAL